MSKLQILGPGCSKCQCLLDRVEKAAGELELDVTTEKIEDIGKILSFGVMRTPALAIEGEVVVMGHVPSVARLKELLAGHVDYLTRRAS